MAIKMDKTMIIVCSVIGSLGVLSAILGFSAEGTKLTPYTILVYGDDCIYPQNPALGLGVCAAIFLLVAQVTFSAVGGCCGCCKSRSIPSETKRIVGVVCAVFSWIAAVIASALLIVGASWNANVVRETAPFCPYLKDGIFAGAAVLTLIATALGVTSYIMLQRQPPPAAPAVDVGTPTSKPTDEQSPPPAGVAMGQPVFPRPGTPQKPSEAEDPPTSAHPQPQGYREAPQNSQSPPPAAENIGSHSHAPNQEFPAQGRPADHAAAAPPAVASAASEPGRPGDLPVPPPVDQPVVPLPLPQAYVAVPITVPQVGMENPVPVPSCAPQPQQGYGQVIGTEIAKAGVKLVAQVVGNTLFSDGATIPTTALSGAGDMLLSMVTDPSSVGAVVEAIC